MGCACCDDFNEKHAARMGKDGSVPFGWDCERLTLLCALSAFPGGAPAGGWDETAEPPQRVP